MTVCSTPVIYCSSIITLFTDPLNWNNLLFNFCRINGESFAFIQQLPINDVNIFECPSLIALLSLISPIKENKNFMCINSILERNESINGSYIKDILWLKITDRPVENQIDDNKRIPKMKTKNMEQKLWKLLKRGHCQVCRELSS